MRWIYIGLLFFVVSGCVLKKDWLESQEQIAELELENEVLNQRLNQMEQSLVDLDSRVQVLEPKTKEMVDSELDSCRNAGDVPDQIRCVARLKGFGAERALRVVRCESGFDSSIHGDGGRAHGLWQYHYKKHPELVDNQWGFSAHDCAHDVICSTDKAIDAINAGHSGWWTCITKQGHSRHRRHRRPR